MSRNHSKGKINWFYFCENCVWVNAMNDFLPRLSFWINGRCLVIYANSVSANQNWIEFVGFVSTTEDRRVWKKIAFETSFWIILLKILNFLSIPLVGKWKSMKGWQALFEIIPMFDLSTYGTKLKSKHFHLKCIIWI